MLGGGRRTLTPTLSKAHFSCVYSANLLMKESSLSGMITLCGGWGGQRSARARPSMSASPQAPPCSCPQASHLRVSTGRGSKLPSASTVAFFSALDEYEAST